MKQEEQDDREDSPPPARVVVVEDHDLLREGLVLMLNAAGDFEVVAQAASAEEALQILDERRPDLLLLDLMLPQMSGTELCRLVRQRQPDIQVVLLTGHAEIAQVLEAVQAGACAYLPKEIGPKELVKALRRVRREGSLLEPFLARRLLAELTRPGGGNGLSLSGPSPSGGSGGPEVGPLSSRELEILRGVVGGGSNREVAENLSISEFTVANHLKSIYRKLGVRDRTQAVLAALNRGLLALIALQVAALGP